MRIVSFLPSATELVYALGLGEQLYGVTHECDYPADARNKPVLVRSVFKSAEHSSADIARIVQERAMSGQSIYEIDRAALQEAQPDLVIIQELCDVCAIPAEQVTEAISGLSPRPTVVSLDPQCIEDVLNDVLRVGEATGATARAQRLVDALRQRKDAVVERAAMATSMPRVACLEWLEPLMCGGHWVPEMVQLAGGESCFGKKGQPSFRLQWQQVVDAQPEIVVAMPCGFDVKRGIAETRLITEREGWEGLPAARDEKLFVVDGGAYFSRSGPRLVDGLEIMAEIIHPELFSGLVPQGAASRIYGQLFKVS